MSYNWEISFVKYPMEYLGLWPDNKYINNLKFIISLIFTLTTLLPCFLSLFFIKSNDDIMNIIIHCGTFFIGLIEIIIFKYKKYNIIFIINLMISNWNASINHLHYQSVMNKYGKLGRKIVLITYGMMLASFIGYILQPIIIGIIEKTTIKKFGNSVWFPFDVESTPNFEITILIYSIGVFYDAMILACVDGFLIIIIFHICGQIEILVDTIVKYDGQIRHTKIDDIVKLHCNCLHCIISKHISLIKLTKAIDNQINFIIFIRLILGILQISIAGYLVSQIEHLTAATVLINIFYLSSILLSCFVYCLVGEKLNIASDKIRIAIYNIDWFKYSSRKIICEIILIIIQCSNNPMKITAGKFFTMSLEFFKEYVTSAGSYLSFLISIKSGK